MEMKWSDWSDCLQYKHSLEPSPLHLSAAVSRARPICMGLFPDGESADRVEALDWVRTDGTGRNREAVGGKAVAVATAGSLRCPERDERVQVLQLSLEYQRILQPVIQAPAENPDERRLIPSSFYHQCPEFNGIIHHRAIPLINGQKAVGGVAGISGAIKHTLEVRL